LLQIGKVLLNGNHNHSSQFSVGAKDTVLSGICHFQVFVLQNFDTFI